eukprot:symbB.v1.2.017088.t1/scaffold1312.1/size125759/10
MFPKAEEGRADTMMDDFGEDDRSRRTECDNVGSR